MFFFGEPEETGVVGSDTVCRSVTAGTRYVIVAQLNFNHSHLGRFIEHLLLEYYGSIFSKYYKSFRTSLSPQKLVDDSFNNLSSQLLVTCSIQNFKHANQVHPWPCLHGVEHLLILNSALDKSVVEAQQRRIEPIEKCFDLQQIKGHRACLQCRPRRGTRCCFDA